jgi:hypothetical protein
MGFKFRYHTIRGIIRNPIMPARRIHVPSFGHCNTYIVLSRITLDFTLPYFRDEISPAAFCHRGTTVATRISDIDYVDQL